MICLVNMPFVMLRRQSLGLPLIAGILKNAGLEVTAFYFNFDLAAMIGPREYINFTNAEECPPYLLQWAFAGMTWGWSERREEESLAALLEYAGIARDSSIAGRLRTLRRVLPRFMQNCAESVKKLPSVSVVGFSCLFMHLPSLALGKMLRSAMPEVKQIYGGAVFHGEPGEEIFDRAEWIDALSNSEADDVAAEAFRRLRAGAPLEGLQGIMHRDRGTGKIYKTPGRYVTAEGFDNGIIPDMDGWFEAAVSHGLTSRGLTASGGNKTAPFAIPFESSRGCWRHERSPCAFCGLNGVSDAYRVKSPANVLKTLSYYRAEFGAERFEATDNSLPPGYFGTFLPGLRETFGLPGTPSTQNTPNTPKISVYYNVKANMSRSRIKALADSGVTLALAGIENFSDRTLKLMNKGITAMENVFFLKCARQYGIFLLWNLMLGTFGETRADRDENAALIPKISHLNPPADPYRTVQVHRFSAYWRDKDRWFEDMSPAGWYKYIFPEGFDLDKIAYYFDVRPKGGPCSGEDCESVRAASSEWRRRWMFDDEPEFFYKEEDGRTVLYDTRGSSMKTVKIVLNGKEAAVYSLLDDITSKRALIQKLKKSEEISACPDCPEEAEAERILDAFAEHGLALRGTAPHGEEFYLGLALREGFRKFSREEKVTLEVTRLDAEDPTEKLVNGGAGSNERVRA